MNWAVIMRECHVKYTIDDEGLTLKEADIVESHCYGNSDQEIADENGISINTLRNYRKIILEKKEIAQIKQLISREKNTKIIKKP